MPPPESAVGFAPADWVLLFFTGIFLLAALIWRSPIQPAFSAFVHRRRACLVAFFLTPIVLRLLLLPRHPVPVPDIYDEFSHLLLADTLLHGRLANPPHPFHQFFETFFVLQQPTYSSIYPCGLALVLATGRLLTGIPWSGILMLSGVLCASCYWMLRGWLTPAWAFLGGLFALIEFGPLCRWTNSYWGGSLAAVGGCLVFGALPRLKRAPRTRDAVLLSIGFGIHMLCRQFVSICLLLAILLFLAPVLARRRERTRLVRPAFSAALAVLPFILLILLQNHAVTHSWSTLPEQLSQYQYGVPAALTFEPNPTPHLHLTAQQQMDYIAQASMHGTGGDSIIKFLLRLEYRVRLYRFFFLPPLYIALVAFFFSLRDRLMAWVACTLAIFALGVNFFPYLLDHYLAAVTCLFILVSLVGLQQLTRISIRNVPVGTQISQVLIVLCLAEFTTWYSLHLFETPDLYPVLQFETWDSINHTNPQNRIDVTRQLDKIKGPLLVFVRYSAHHIYQNEWVWNAADIDASRVVYARDLGPAEDAKLIRYYPNRQVLLLEPDAYRPLLSAYAEK
jgi:hypothetical protein